MSKELWTDITWKTEEEFKEWFDTIFDEKRFTEEVLALKLDWIRLGEGTTVTDPSQGKSILDLRKFLGDVIPDVLKERSDEWIARESEIVNHVLKHVMTRDLGHKLIKAVEQLENQDIFEPIKLTSSEPQGWTNKSGTWKPRAGGWGTWLEKTFFPSSTSDSSFNKTIADIQKDYERKIFAELKTDTKTSQLQTGAAKWQNPARETWEDLMYRYTDETGTHIEVIPAKELETHPILIFTTGFYVMVNKMFNLLYFFYEESDYDAEGHSHSMDITELLLFTTLYLSNVAKFIMETTVAKLEGRNLTAKDRPHILFNRAEKTKSNIISSFEFNIATKAVNLIEGLDKLTDLYRRRLDLFSKTYAITRRLAFHVARNLNYYYKEAFGINPDLTKE